MAHGTELTARIVKAYTAHNSVSYAALPNLIENVHRALNTLGRRSPSTAVAIPKPDVGPKPKKTVFPEFIISLEDGKKYKSLTRHLGTFGLTPGKYRKKWGLPENYPMEAPALSERRSIAAARKMGTSAQQSTKASAAGLKKKR